MAVAAVLLLPVALYGVAKAYDAWTRSEDPVTPDRGAIIGTWTNPDGAQLVLRADGTYTASGMPYISDQMPPPLGPSSVLPADGQGTWVIEPWDAGSGSGGGLALTSNQDEIELSTTGDAADPSLFASIGDPDEGNDFTFAKKD